MKYQHVQRIYKNPFYVNFKKHYCPNCGVVLKKIKISKIVNSRSKEASDFKFEFGETFMIGNVKFIWNEFQCPECKKIISIDEMRYIEKERSKM